MLQEVEIHPLALQRYRELVDAQTFGYLERLASRLRGLTVGHLKATSMGMALRSNADMVDSMVPFQGPVLPIEPGQLKAVIVDVDGTLYRQSPVRRAMFWRLLRAHLGQPVRGLLTFRVLRAYRRAQEVLRASPPDDGDLAKSQLRLASKWTGVGSDIVSSFVARWMEQEPLELVAGSLREGLLKFLQAATERGLRLGVFSDYPSTAKLVAMGVTDFFSVAVSAQDPEVQQFKPSPRGLEVTLRRLGVEKRHALYVGDRPEVDAAAASAAGIACVIIGRWTTVHRGAWVEMPSYSQLNDAICPR